MPTKKTSSIEPSEEVEVSIEFTGARAAGAQLLVAQLSIGSTLHTEAKRYVQALGGLQDSYTGVSPAEELLGLEGLLEHLKRHCPKVRLGNAAGLRAMLRERMDNE